MNSNVRIIDIAKAAKFSASTVSFVLNGRGDDLGISAKTQKHILKIAHELGYRANIPAKKLRNSDGQATPYITVFFALNNTMNRIPEVILGMHKSLSFEGIAPNFNIKPYMEGSLEKEFGDSHANLFNAAVIAGASDKDIAAIEKMSILTPVVILNRNSDIFNAVFCDTYKMGYAVGELFKRRGHNNVALVGLKNSYYNADMRTKGFLDSCRDNGLTISQENIKRAELSFSGGEKATESILSSDDMPTAIFYIHNTLAVGSLGAFKSSSVKIPHDVEIITYGDSDYLEYTSPSISAIYAPIEEITASAIDLLLDVIDNNRVQPITKELESCFVTRQSCGS